MGTKLNPGVHDCYHKAASDEPIFTLRAKDPLAASLVRKWAEAARLSGAHAPAKILEAQRCADAMDNWRKLRTQP